jgi:CBS domain containing-hemolysin-like protein
MDIVGNILKALVVLAIVLLNGFFVVAEFETGSDRPSYCQSS